MKEVAVGIIVRNGQVLACQRKRTARYPLKWEFPGGQLEAGESPEHALVRELSEELGIKAVGHREFFQQEWVYKEGMSNPERDGAYRVYYFLVREFSGEPVNYAFEQIRWTTPAELQYMDILEGNREAVERLVQYAQTHETA
ncbi:MAG: NUDIX hydrolase [Ignavibacteria bacterium]